MKICYLNHDLRDDTGAGRFGLALIGRLKAAWPVMEAVVFTSVGCGHALEEPVLFTNPWKFLAVLPRIRRIFKTCDIIHALDGWPYGAIAAFVSFGLGKRLIITAIGTGAVQPLYDWRRPILTWAYRRADEVVAISSNTKGEVLKRCPGLDIKVINHAIDADEFMSFSEAELSEEEAKAIRRLKPYILSVGGWKKRKGFEYSFSAFGEILEKFSDLKYVICGIGSQPHLTEPLGITGLVHYFKRVRWPFLKALYKNAELFMLLPVDDNKDIEGFGFTFLEAAAAGLPVIGTTQSSAEDAVSHGENGFLVPQRDSASAAAAAVRILSSPELKRRLQETSLAFARRMNWQAVVSRYLTAYRQLLS